MQNSKDTYGDINLDQNHSTQLNRELRTQVSDTSNTV